MNQSLPKTFLKEHARVQRTPNCQLKPKPKQPFRAAKQKENNMQNSQTDQKATSFRTQFSLASMALSAVIALGVAPVASAAQRPISDFVNRQGTYCLQTDSQGNIDCSTSHYGGGPGCFLFTPPGPNLVGWSDPNANYFTLVDYAGLADQLLGGVLGTTTDGSINEVPQTDGRAEVSIVLNAHNALTWAITGLDSATGPLLFGHRVQDVAAGADAALGDCTLRLKFFNTAPGAPLPDFIQLLFCPDPGQQITFFGFTAQASGTLRANFGVSDGTPGRLECTQTGPVTTPCKKPPFFDCFPTEHIIISAVGH